MGIPRIQGPAALYRHDHVIKNINQEFHEQQTPAQRLADWLAELVGSWRFIVYQTIVFIFWVGVNGYLAYMIASHWNSPTPWDPYPFILLNLVLSFQAAYTGPVVMMSQNRQTAKDRLMAELDYQVNKKAEEEIKVIMDHLVHQDAIIEDLLLRLEEVYPGFFESNGPNSVDPHDDVAE